jgi:hypothetical protein
MGLFVSGCKVMMDMCEHSNEPLGTIKSRYFLYGPLVSEEGPCFMNLTHSKIMKSVEKKSVQSSCYGLDGMKTSYCKESIHCCMCGVVQP